jgi:hypothetical protein
MNKFKNRKTKRAVEHTPFLKKIAACQLVCVCVCVCEIVRLSGFERPQKSKIKKIDACILEKKIVNLASKNIIFEVLGTERCSSQLLMTDSFF